MKNSTKKKSFRKREMIEVFCCDCGERFDTNDEVTIVYDTKEEAIEELTDYGWTVKGDDAFCEDCQKIKTIWDE